MAPTFYGAYSRGSGKPHIYKPKNRMIFESRFCKKKKKYRELEPVKREGTGQLDAGHSQLITRLHRVNVSIYFCM